MFKVTIKSMVSDKTLDIRISGHRQHHHASTTIIGVSSRDNAKICEFVRTDCDRNLAHEGLFVDFLNGATYELDGWEIN